MMMASSNPMPNRPGDLDAVSAAMSGRARRTPLITPVRASRKTAAIVLMYRNPSTSQKTHRPMRTPIATIIAAG